MSANWDVYVLPRTHSSWWRQLSLVKHLTLAWHLHPDGRACCHARRAAPNTPRRVAHTACNAAPMARDDAEEALVVEDFEYSAAQQRYQVEAQSQRGNNDAMREELFYKDATPKAEHYISFVVRLPPNRRPRKGAAHALADAPLDLELLYAPSAPGEDYVTVPDQGHLKRCEPARRDGDPKGPSERPRLGLTLRYRIELGSYRQGDRRFVVRATIAKAARGGDASPPRPGTFLPAHTPPARRPRRRTAAVPPDGSARRRSTSRPR